MLIIIYIIYMDEMIYICGNKLKFKNKVFQYLGKDIGFMEKNSISI